MTKKIFAINAGSSSLKFQLLEMPSEIVITKGIFERIGSSDAEFTIKYGTEKEQKTLPIQSHQEAVDNLLNVLISKGIIQSLNEINGVGHRVAHGGEEFQDSAIINESVLQTIENLNHLAPKHNPVNVIGIKAFRAALPNVKSVAVFDTAFHHTIKPEVYNYPIPYKYYEKYRIRKYGFHGTSHEYIYKTITSLLDKREEGYKIISCHLGNGSSICAIDNGRSVNTSMGFTPLAGLMMGTRSGDIDPSIIPFIAEKEHKSNQDMNKLLNNDSGLLGVSGISNDLRDIEEAATNGNKRAELAIKMFVNRVAETISAYVSNLNGVDAIVFTAGIGENSATIRSLICKKLSFLNLTLDEKKNGSSEAFIETSDSRVKVAVIPTNEEVVIARDVLRIKQETNPYQSVLQ
ncbi:acetate kinase [Desemzia sp. C1]|uniref:acetate/propionate family kinase n=1 Tax=Desemzia sp. C1 TaxID=2892016 RepID=UPI001E4526CB|nr:acetate kinase [Desemzia sp. C1]MCI3029310.1 acetate kinase [Desemzia sp. C1]